MTTATPYQGPFLFINRDASNIKHRSPDEAYAVGSHIAARYTQWSKISRLRVSRITRPKLNTQAITRERSDNETTADEAETCWTVSNSSATYDRQQHISQGKSVTTATQARKRALQSLVRQTSPNPMTLMQHGNSDPFLTSSVEITPLNSYLIKTWQNIFMQTVYPSEVLKRISVTSDENADIIACPERIHFMLAWALMLQHSGMPESETKKKLEMEALNHKSAGMNSLRRKLPTMAKLTAIRAIWHLLGAEFYAGNFAAAQTHFRALADMVKSVGGLGSLPWQLRKLIVVADMTLSGAVATSSGFDVDEWDPGSVTPILLVSETDILATYNLTQQPLHGSVPPRLTNIFHAYRELLAVHHLAARIQNPSRLTTLLCWAQMREYALSTRVTNLKAVLDELPDSAETNIKKATCVAVDYFMQILWLESHPERTVFAPFHHSEGSSEILEAVVLLEMSLLTLWILFVAATVEFIVGKRGRRSSFFAKKFTCSLQGLGLRSLGQIRQALEPFLYEDVPFEQYLLELVRPIVNLEATMDGNTDSGANGTVSGLSSRPKEA